MKREEISTRRRGEISMGRGDGGGRETEREGLCGDAGMRPGDGELDELVLAYLRKRGYEQAEMAMKKEWNEAERKGRGGEKDPEDEVARRIPLYALADEDPVAYAKGYGMLVQWVDHSLDMYKGELGRLLFPVFVRCYLELINHGKTAEAQKLLDTQQDRFVERGGMFADEVGALHGVVLPEQIESDATAKRLWKAKYRVRLCEYSFELLKRFLHTKEMLLILSVINARVILVVGDQKPSQDESEIIIATDVDDDALQVNTVPIQLQLLEKNMEDLLKQEQEKDNGEEKNSKKTKKEEKKAKALEASRLKSRIPLPELPPEVVQARLQQMKHRQALSPENLPSIAFYTFVSTYNSMSALSFNVEGSTVAAGFLDSSVRLYDCNGSGVGGLNSMAPDSSPSLGNCAPVDPDAPFTRLIGHSGPVYGVDFSPDEELLLSCSADGTIRLWSTEMKANLVSYRGHNNPVWDVKWCPQGAYFASACHDRTARLWVTDRTYPLRIFSGHATDVDVLQWHPNCHYIATGSSDKSLRLWDVRTGDCVRLLVGHHGTVTSLAFSPDGKTLASGADNGTVMLWDIAQGKKLVTLYGHGMAVNSLSFCAEGSLLASGGADDNVCLFNTTLPFQNAVGSGQDVGSIGEPLLQKYRTKATPVYQVQFTPSNVLLAGGAFCRTEPREIFI